MPKVVLKDHYVVLGADRGAPAEELKRLYRKRAREIHPDLLGPDASAVDRKEGEELFKELSVAFEQLSDNILRRTIDLWLTEQTEAEGLRNYADDCYRTTYHEPIKVPDAGQHLLNGIWCWVEFQSSGWYYGLRATVTVQLADIFSVVDLGSLPNDAWLEEVIAVDEKGDVVGRGYSLASLRFNIRRLQAEARRNINRRTWRQQLAGFECKLEDLAKQQRPVGRLRTLLSEARRCVESGGNSPRYAEHPDTVIRAIREVEKEIERVVAIDATELLLADLLGGKLSHPDVRYNQKLLHKLRVYEFRSGSAYTAPTQEAVEAHYRQRLAGLTTQDQVYRVDLKLPNDEPTILEFAQEGAIELAPNHVEVQGTKKPTSYEVTYGYAKVSGELVPAGIITVPEATYERNSAQYGRISKFPSLPYGISLLIRVRVKVQDNEALTDPYPDGKALQNEVARCRARLRNPKELVESYGTSTYLVSWPF